MNHYVRTLLTLFFILLFTTACGQKGPLIVESTSIKTGEVINQEVTDKDPVLNTQTEDISTTR